MNGAVPALLASCLALGACGQATVRGGGSTTAAAADDPVSFGKLADFRLTERSGREVTRADLAGRTWIVDFIFTTCSGPCPKLTSSMRKLQDDLEDTGVGLLSITVDPETDDPEKLDAYASSWTADPDRWWFLTGDEDQIHALMSKSFMLGVERVEGAPKGEQVTHSTRLVVVDREGDLRGYYDGQNDEGRRSALARARALDAHP
jgi:cytochrome oxidase Cu insertion factor (SCO1/SenC/PrrC family)